MMMNPSNRSPFTTTQWEELEHQALIYKYMISGVPVPRDLISTVKRSLDLSMSSRLFPHQPRSWECAQMGFCSRKVVDPEPGRCRRTDGKKWRCSKEAHPDSKYCERHRHRGRNRFRKVEQVGPSLPISSSTTSALGSSPRAAASSAQAYSLSTPAVVSFRPSNSTLHQLFLDPSYYTSRSPEDSISVSAMARGLNDLSKEYQRGKQGCVMGTDFQSAKQINVEQEHEIQKPFHHFFSEYSWFDTEENQPSRANVPTTQLSISMPTSTQELFGSTSRLHKDK